YEPPSGFNGPDSFIYTISDGRGGAATGTVNVVLVPGGDEQTQNIVSITSSGSDVIVDFAGTPGRTYRIETTADRTPPITSTRHRVRLRRQRPECDVRRRGSRRRACLPAGPQRGSHHAAHREPDGHVVARRAHRRSKRRSGHKRPECFSQFVQRRAARRHLVA